MKNHTAIITAASQGIGAACAREFAARGYNVVVMSRSEAIHTLASELGGVAVQGSLTHEADLKRLVETTLHHFGRIDAVVNNAGHPAKGRVLDISDEQWHEGFDLLYLSVVRMARFVTPAMLSQGSGAIVNISSYAAVEPSSIRPVSSALRAALSSFTKLYADDYAARNIRMNSILPGFVDSYDVDAATLAQIPMNRIGSVKELAQTAAFLCSPESGYITGQSLRLDGGLTRSL